MIQPDERKKCKTDRRDAAALQAIAVTGMVDQDATHRFRGGGEEVTAAVGSQVLHEPQVRFVDERRGLVRLTRPLGGPPRGREPPQLLVAERE